MALPWVRGGVCREGSSRCITGRLLRLRARSSGRERCRLSRAELAHIRGEAPDTAGGRVAWIQLLGQRQTWAVVVGKLLADPIWWFYLYWVPQFLDAK